MVTTKQSYTAVVRVDAALLKRAKIKAAKDGCKTREVVDAALKLYLGRPA